MECFFQVSLKLPLLKKYEFEIEQQFLCSHPSCSPSCIVFPSSHLHLSLSSRFILHKTGNTHLSLFKIIHLRTPSISSNSKEKNFFSVAAPRLPTGFLPSVKQTVQLLLLSFSLCLSSVNQGLFFFFLKLPICLCVSKS